MSQSSAPTPSLAVLVFTVAILAGLAPGIQAQFTVPGPAIPAPVPVTPPIQLQDVAQTVGLGTNYEPGGDGHCPGVVFTDLSGDGFPEIYLPQGNLGGNPQANRLWLNNANGTFTEINNAAGANDIGNSAGAIAADFTNDGLRDLYVINMLGPNTFYLLTPSGYIDVTNFTDPTPGDPSGDTQEGLALACDTGETVGAGCTLNATLAAAAGDFNRDGWLDLYVGNHLCCGFTEGQRDVLYINNQGRFTDVTVAAGIEVPNPQKNSSTQAVQVADFNNDRWPDIYVSHKSDGPSGNRDQLFMNDGDANGDNVWDGTFTEYFANQSDPDLGRYTCQAMGIDAADYDHDQDLDVYLTDISGGGCSSTPPSDMDLYDNLWSDQGAVFDLAIVQPNPVPAPDWGWGVSWQDLDNDRDQELHVATHVGRQNYLYRNDNAGAGFTDITVAAGIAVTLNSRATIPADYDRDGRVDILFAHREALPVQLFQNQTAQNAATHWLEVAVIGNTQTTGPFHSTTDAVGARIEVIIPGTGQTLRRDVFAGGHSCASTRDYIAHFGVGRATSVDVKIFWPSGQTTRLPGQSVDQILVVTEH